MKIGTWFFRLYKPFQARNHKIFTFRDGGNILIQIRYIKLGKYVLHIERTRNYKNVKNIQSFYDNIPNRLGRWS